MAIAMEFDHPNGGHVIIRDDCCRDLTKEELARRRRQISRAIWRINDLLCRQGDDERKEAETHDQTGAEGLQGGAG
ncbi:MAG: hypothetical protein IJV64_07720 [Oscillospiraceae bacterium]|nr:hypothetical protein [Oscillospiraceae bacterium]